ncbi:ORF1027 [White spot syndrome virus]|uniref:ORF1027 n=1 Tax=White spot syndrome virus TaxID=342409 RepID=A0A2D3I709_9VIRU|nr:ORF1027 [White spot syndrome virus]
MKLDISESLSIILLSSCFIVFMPVILDPYPNVRPALLGVVVVVFLSSGDIMFNIQSLFIRST